MSEPTLVSAYVTVHLEYSDGVRAGFGTKPLPATATTAEELLTAVRPHLVELAADMGKQSPKVIHDTVVANTTRARRDADVRAARAIAKLKQKPPT